MEKQIFIAKTLIHNSLLENCSLDVLITDSEYSGKQSLITSSHYYAVLGFLNAHLEDKANAKKIIKVSHFQRDIENDLNIYIGSNGVWKGFTEGYLITYLESEMIANKDDLENLFKWCAEGFFMEDFNDWFNENFK